MEPWGRSAERAAAQEQHQAYVRALNLTEAMGREAWQYFGHMV